MDENYAKVNEYYMVHLQNQNYLDN